MKAGLDKMTGWDGMMEWFKTKNRAGCDADGAGQDGDSKREDDETG